MIASKLNGIRTQIGRLRSRAAELYAARPRGRDAYAMLAVAAIVVVGLCWSASSVYAAKDPIEKMVVVIIGYASELIIWLLASVLLIVVGVLVNVAQYNSFVTSPAVGLGWSILRDVVNMFFIVVLLIMAFATILGMDNYSIKGGKLTRLLIMAIVINFSRTLCGIMIDFGQVVMLTFVSGFKDAAGGNFMEAMKITEMMQASDSSKSEGADASTTAIVVSMLLAVVMTAIATFVVIMMTITLIVRIVFLWLLVVLSPLAFFLKAVPGGAASGFYGKWWSKFTSNVIVGPFLAFFLWLSLAVVQQGDVTAGFPARNEEESFSDEVSAAFNSQSVQQFMIGVCLLLGGYTMATEMAGETMGMAKQIRQGATKYAQKAGRMSLRAGRGVAVTADNLSGGRLDKLKEAGLAQAMRLPSFMGGGLAKRALIDSRAKSAEIRSRAEKEIGGLPPEYQKYAASMGTGTVDKSGKLTPAGRVQAVMGKLGRLTPAGRARAAAVAKNELSAALISGNTAKVKEAMDQHSAFVKDDPSYIGDRWKAIRTRPAAAAANYKEWQDLEKKKAAGQLSKAEEERMDIVKTDGRAFESVVGSLSPQKIGEMNKDDLTDDVMAKMNPKALTKALDFAGTDVTGKINAFLNRKSGESLAAGLESEEKQRYLKQREQELLPTINSKMSNAQVAAIDGAELTPAVLSALADNKKGRALTTEQVAKVDAEALGKNVELSKQIADGLKLSGINELAKNPDSIGQASVLKAALQSRTLENFSLNPSGNFSGSYADEGRAQFRERAKESPAQAAELAASISPSVLTAGGGVNEVAIELVTNIDATTVNQMAEAKNPAMMQAAQGIAAIKDPAEIAAKLVEKMRPSLGHDSDEFKAEIKIMMERIARAQEASKQIIQKAAPKGIAGASAAGRVKSA
ncbi:MAG: hypothetical protein WCT10_04160 [Patescibacteria group bacterium]|jgi:hypothetical protein